MKMLAVVLLSLLAVASAGKIKGFNDLGCWRDKVISRAMTGKMTTAGGMTMQKCSDICKDFQYFGLQYKVECFCGDSYDKYGSANNCNLPCGGDPSENCGGNWALRVFEVKASGGGGGGDQAPGTYIGCYRDQGNRAMTGKWTNGNDINNEVCMDRCAKLGFKYAATQFSRHCFCGNSYDKYGPANNCNMKCAASSETCGGAWANQVYVSKEKATPAPTPAPTPLQFIGCYRDNGNRDLTGDWTNGNHVNNRQCVARCTERGFLYAATQFSRHCFCGNSYGKYGTANNCNMKCAASEEKCGGAWANQVYKAGAATAEPTPEATPAPTPAPEATPAPTPAPEATPAPTPAPEATPAPTPAPEKETCVKQRARFAENGLPVEPAFIEGSCKFVPKQCNDEKCFCVKSKSGKRRFGKVEVPLGHEFDCAKKPRKCFQKLFKILIEAAGKKPEWTPNCTARGQFAPMQCQKNKCWCVKKRGREIKGTRTKGKANC